MLLLDSSAVLCRAVDVLYAVFLFRPGPCGRSLAVATKSRFLGSVNSSVNEKRAASKLTNPLI